jgi:long-subunit acyl-CoA synthetase (AMP-forming)
VRSCVAFRAIEATAASYCADGFWRSGDRVELTREGTLRVVGRLSEDQIELYSGGDSVWVSNLQAVYHGCSHVMQLVLDCNRDDRVLTAVVVPVYKVLIVLLPFQT